MISDDFDFNKVQCVFSDLDRTLLDKDSRISEANLNAIEGLIRAGICFVPVTGRAYASLPADLKKIPEIEYCITSNGTAVCRLSDGRPVLKRCLPKGFIKTFYEYFDTLGRCGLEFYYEGRAYTSREFYDDPVSFNQRRVEYVRTTRTPVDDLKSFAEEHDGETDAICIIAPVGRFEELCVDVRRTFDGVYITNSDSLYIEISNILCGKKNAIADFCKMMGYDLSRTVAFGDNDNDADMLSAAGVGICVANGTPKCIEAADMLTAAHDEDGFAKGLELLMKGVKQ